MWPIIIRQVSGESMSPVLRGGDTIYGLRWFNTLKINDIVIVTHEGKEKIKIVTKIKDDQVYLTSGNRKRRHSQQEVGFVNIKSVKARVIWPRS